MGTARILYGRQHRLDILGAVLQIEPDVLAGLDASVDQPVRQPVGPLLELGEGALGPATAQGDPCGHLV